MNQRGSALIEGLTTMTFMVVVTGAILTAGYAVFARAYIEHQSEQTLYCLAENEPLGQCRWRLRRAIARALPYGAIGRLEVTKRSSYWEVEFTWTLSKFTFRIHKSLSLRDIVRTRGSRSSS